MSASAETMIALVSGDGRRFVLPLETACASPTICMIAKASVGFKEGEDDCINFPSMSGSVLSEIVRFLPLRHANDAAFAARSTKDPVCQSNRLGSDKCMQLASNCRPTKAAVRSCWHLCYRAFVPRTN